MDYELETAKEQTWAWALNQLEKLPFVVATDGRGRKRWVNQDDKSTIDLPEQPGIYLIYQGEIEVPIYIGESKNLKQRLNYHFSENSSSNQSSTLKKNLRRSGHLNDNQSLRDVVRVRFFPIAFGRVEIEELLHRRFKINTARRKK